MGFGLKSLISFPLMSIHNKDWQKFRADRKTKVKKQAFFLLWAFNLATRVQMEVKPKAKFVRSEDEASCYY